MGPATLLCPSSSSVQLWGQVSPLKKTRQKEGGISLPHSCLRCSANAHCTGEYKRRSPFFLHLAPSSEACRRTSYRFAWRRVSAAASGGEVSVEEATIVSDERSADSGEATSKATARKEETPVTEQASAAAERRTQPRRSFNRSNSNANKATVVSPAELIPGTMFPGKVISIQTFGAFVDLGAFTNGLVHISRLSKSFVKKVEDVVQVGQDVKVQVLEVDVQANRISLMLVEEGKEEVSQEGAVSEKQPPRAPQQQTRPPRRDSSKRQPTSQRQAFTTTMKKGEIATGTVKNMIRSGVFINLPDGNDGYLPSSEMIFKGPNTSIEANFQVGQELSVRVLRIDKGRINLTMKREVNFDKLNEDLNEGVDGGATNPFELAFRRNELIASFLADRDKRKAEAEATEGAVKEEADGFVKEVIDVAEVEKPELKAEEEKVVNAVDTPKDEAEVEKPGVKVEEEKVVNVAATPKVEAESFEEVKAAAQSDKPAVKEEEEEVGAGLEAREDEAVLSDSAEEGSAAAELEKPVTEEEGEKATYGIDTVLSEAINSVEEVKGAVEVEKPVEKEDEKVTGEDAATKDKGVLSEAVNSVEEKEDENVAGEDAATKAEGVLSEAVDSAEDEKAVGESVAKKDVLSEAVNSVAGMKDPIELEKPVVKQEDEKVGDGIELMKGEGVSSEADSSGEEIKDTVEVEKPTLEDKDKKGVYVDAAKGEAAFSEAGAENVITMA